MADEIRRGSSDAGELSRRDLLRGTAAAGIVVGADSYVKPTLRLLGVTRLNAAASTLPRRRRDDDDDDDQGQNQQ